MKIVAVVLLVVGALLSLYILADNFAYWRVKDREPQGAPRRILPEAHVLSALLGAAGAWLLAGFPIAAGVFAGWLAAAFVLTWLLSR